MHVFQARHVGSFKSEFGIPELVKTLTPRDFIQMVQLACVLEWRCFNNFDKVPLSPVVRATK